LVFLNDLLEASMRLSPYFILFYHLIDFTFGKTIHFQIPSVFFSLFAFIGVLKE